MLFFPRYLCAFVQVATCADIDMHNIDTTIPAIEYTTIPANKGAEGAVSVRERAVNEAALAVCFAPVSHGVFVCGCVFVVQRPASPAASLVAALVLCSRMRSWRVLGVRCGEGRCHVRPRHRPRLKPAGQIKF